MEDGNDQTRREYHRGLIIAYLSRQMPDCDVSFGGGGGSMTDMILVESKSPPELYRLLVGRAVLEDSKPDEVFLESIFHHRSAKSALVLGHARGVAMLAASRLAKPIGEIAPAEVKKAVTGSGRADKHQVQEMIRGIIIQ